MDERAEWTKLPDTEREDYAAFHENAYGEDLRHSDKNLLEFPRWSIISGYYAMHDITKLFLARKFGIKMPAEHTHEITIRALEEFIKEAELRNKILELLKKAEITYYDIDRLRERVVPVLLRHGRRERGRSQYYNPEQQQQSEQPSQTAASRKAAFFIENIVKPYVKIVEGLMAEG